MKLTKICLMSDYIQNILIDWIKLMSDILVTSLNLLMSGNFGDLIDLTKFCQMYDCNQDIVLYLIGLD